MNELHNRDEFISQLLERVNKLEKKERDMKDVLGQCRSVLITMHPEVQSEVGKRVVEKKIRIINLVLDSQEKKS